MGLRDTAKWWKLTNGAYEAAQDRRSVPTLFTAGNPLEVGHPYTVQKNVDSMHDQGLLYPTNPNGFTRDQAGRAYSLLVPTGSIRDLLTGGHADQQRQLGNHGEVRPLAEDMRLTDEQRRAIRFLDSL